MLYFFVDPLYILKLHRKQLKQNHVHENHGFNVGCPWFCACHEANGFDKVTIVILKEPMVYMGLRYYIRP